MSTRGINKVILIGNLGGDPEVRYTPSGSAIANLTLATNESWKDKQSGDIQERTEWHRVVLFNRLAEIVGEYLKKGAKIYIEGSLRTRKWQDKNGVERYTTEIVGSEMQMLDGRGAEGMKNQSGQPFNQQKSSPTNPASQANDPFGGSNDFDDDIPF